MILNYIITIINSILLIYIFTHKHFSIRKNETIFNNTLLGYSFNYKGKRYAYLPIRPARKTKVKEEVGRMMKANNQSKHQILGAKFSWLKTIEDVMQFKKDYEIVDPKKVNDLVNEFKLKNYNHGKK